MIDPKFIELYTRQRKVIEECSELIQAICKADRFGWFNYHPDRPRVTNLTHVRDEMDDVVEAIASLEVELIQLNFIQRQEAAE